MLSLGDIIYRNNNTYIYIGSKDELCEENKDKVFYIKSKVKEREYLSYFIILDKIVEANKIEEVLNQIYVVNISCMSLEFLRNYEYAGNMKNLKTFLLKRKMLGDTVPDFNELMDEKVLVDRYKRQIKYLEKKYPKLVSLTQGSIVKDGTTQFIYLGMHRNFLYNTNVVV